MKQVAALALAGIVAAGAAGAAQPRDSRKPVSALAGRPSQSSTPAEVPVQIRGRQVVYTGREGRARFTGGVTVTRGSSTLMCDELDTVQGTSEALAKGHVHFRDDEHRLDLLCDEALYTHGLSRLEAKGNCVLLAGEAPELTTVTATAMEVLVESREALAHGGVRIVQGEDEALCADAHLYGAENRVVLTGRPVLRRPPHEFECDQLTTYFREGRSVLTGSVRGRLAPERLEQLKKEGLGK